MTMLSNGLEVWLTDEDPGKAYVKLALPDIDKIAERVVKLLEQRFDVALAEKERPAPEGTGR